MLTSVFPLLLHTHTDYKLTGELSNPASALLRWPVFGRNIIYSQRESHLTVHSMQCMVKQAYAMHVVCTSVRLGISWLWVTAMDRGEGLHELNKLRWCQEEVKRIPCVATRNSCVQCGHRTVKHEWQMITFEELNNHQQAYPWLANKSAMSNLIKYFAAVARYMSMCVIGLVC